MMTVNIKKYLFFGVVLLGISSCSKVSDFGDTNVDPGRTEIPSTAALLSNAEVSMAGYVTSTRGGLYCQYFSETQYPGVSLYSLPSVDFDLEMAGSIMDCQNVINFNKDSIYQIVMQDYGTNANQIAAARIVKAFMMWHITDRWGDIPYFEALQGKKNLRPAYDTQEAIYRDLLKELKEAAGQFDGTGLGTLKGDLLFLGDASKWQRFANSLRLLIALRMSKVYPEPTGFAAAEFNDARLGNNIIDARDSSENVTINYPGASYKNAWFNLYNGRSDYGQSDRFVDFVFSLSNGDYRAFQWGTAYTLAFPYGVSREAAVAFGNNNPGYSRILASTERTESSPLTILSSASINFALAEAVKLGWIGGDASTYYNNGIRASYSQWHLTKDSTDIARLGNYQGSVALVGSDAVVMEAIHAQQYLAWYPNGTQGWCEWRRTGVPALSPTVNAVNPSKQIPRRYVYGDREFSTNGEHVAEAIARMPGGNSQDGRVWWDQ
jgi:hypothetical protein